jgi:hypothetical protein
VTVARHVVRRPTSSRREGPDAKGRRKVPRLRSVRRRTATASMGTPPVRQPGIEQRIDGSTQDQQRIERHEPPACGQDGEEALRHQGRVDQEEPRLRRAGAARSGHDSGQGKHEPLKQEDLHGIRGDADAREEGGQRRVAADPQEGGEAERDGEPRLPPVGNERVDGDEIAPCLDGRPAARPPRRRRMRRQRTIRPSIPTMKPPSSGARPPAAPIAWWRMGRSQDRESTRARGSAKTTNTASSRDPRTIREAAVPGRTPRAIIIPALR